MESSPRSRAGEIASHIGIIVVTAVNLIFITRFYKYVAWYTFAPDGSVTPLPLLTEDYFVWLPIPIAASVLAIAAYSAMIVYDRYWFQMAAQIVVTIAGIVVVVSLVSIFPFDFSVIPNATVVEVAPTVVTAFLVLMMVVYGVTALTLFVRLVRRYTVKQETG